MAQPVWITPAGNLGTIAENAFFSLPLVARDPDGAIVRYVLVAGNLPSGVQVKEAEDTGGAIAKVQGVPAETDYDITFKFVIRAYVDSAEGRLLADRTFSITVSGQSTPQFITPAGSIGVFYEGSEVAAQIEFDDPDPHSVVTASIFSGELPPGTTINSNGLISGIINPVEDVTVGFDGSPFDLYPFDFTSSSFNQNYQFTVKIFDGITPNFRTFDMYVVNRNTLTADTTQITADVTYITADETSKINPYISNYPENGYIGLFRSGNYFAYQIKGAIYNNGPIYYELIENDSSYNLPIDLQFNSNTGWLYGNIKDYGVTDLKFDFVVYVYDATDPSNVSIEYRYTLEIIGSIENSVIWLNKSATVTTDGSIDLGSIVNGSISLFAIEAINNTGESLQFRLKPGNYPEVPGVYNKLPQGLSLLPSGEIAGRVSFDTFALDGGTTTFDEQLATKLIQRPTTFDMVYRFTVEAYSSNGAVSVFQLFSIRVVREFNEPYNSIYIQAMLSQDDRNLLSQLLQNQDIMKPNLIFRQNDPYFGVARNVIYTHVYAINSTQIQNYVAAMNLNHYRKQITLGEIKVAQALDSNDNVVYEVVYSEIVDNAVNKEGQSPGPSVKVEYPFVYDGILVDKVYPNSLVEMRNQLVQEIGNIPSVLPLWMRSKQTNGTVLGFVKCWVIAYAKPGKGQNLAYNIREQYGEQLNRIDFIADRYELDRQYSKNWIPYNSPSDPGRWYPITATDFDEQETTFDGNSLQFNTPADKYGLTDEYNKYLLFPKTNILG